MVRFTTKVFFGCLLLLPIGLVLNRERWENVHETVWEPRLCSEANQEKKTVLDGLLEDDAEGWSHRLARSNRQRQKQIVSSPKKGSYFFQENWHPTFSCETAERLGSSGDGGKWVCNPDALLLKQHILVYSLGSNEDFTFEEALFDKYGDRVEIHTFDPAPEPIAIPSFVHYHPILVTSLSDIMQQNQTVDILKMDVEGAETKLLDDEEALKNVNQLLVEIHLDPLFWPSTSPRVVHDLMMRLSSSFEIFSKEPNTLFGGGIACEFGFVRVPWDEICAG